MTKNDGHRQNDAVTVGLRCRFRSNDFRSNPFVMRSCHHLLVMFSPRCLTEARVQIERYTLYHANMAGSPRNDDLVRSTFLSFRTYLTLLTS